MQISFVAREICMSVGESTILLSPSISTQVFAEVAVTSRHSMLETPEETAEKEVSNTTKETGGEIHLLTKLLQLWPEIPVISTKSPLLWNA